MKVLRLLHDIATANDGRLLHLWGADGPPGTEVESHGMFLLQGKPIYVQEFKGGGFDIYTPVTASNSIDATMRAVAQYAFPTNDT